MLIGIISDTHMPRGGRRLPESCVERLRACDLILHAGDVMTEEVLERMQAIGPPLLAVHGNVDSPALRARLPAERTVEAGGARIGMVHDSGAAKGRLARLRRRFPEANAVVFGHSHLPLHDEAEGFQIFNPGSPTERRRAPAHTMGIARVEHGRVAFDLVELG
jgi:uncharacterized protein